MEANVARTIDSPRHEALRVFIIGKREKAGLRQVDVAQRLGRYQSYISYVEGGHKVMDVVELMEWAEAIGFDPREAISYLSKVPKQ
jgi:transcriptional regulator with XRE-family HTH domain